MRLVTALVALGLLASLIESCQQGADVDDCLARTYKTQRQCEEAP